MNNVKSNIEFYLPGLIEAVGDSILDWDYIDNLFIKKLENRIQEGGGQSILVEATIFDIIIEVKKGNVKAINLLDFFNKLLQELALNLSAKEKKLIKDNVRNALTAFDKRYLTFVGELAVLNNILKSKIFRLEDVETKLPNGKTIDFKVRNIENDKFNLIEVYNIFLDNERVDVDEEKIKKFLNGRLERKILDKNKGLLEDISLYIVPVLWGGWENIKIYSEHFKRNEIEISNVVEPVAYLTFTDPNDDNFVLHNFGTVSTLFDFKYKPDA